MAEPTRYDEEEFALILGKAAELERESGSERTARLEADAAEYTLEEMRSIAAEAGLDPDAVSAAAALVRSRPSHESSDLGGRLTLRYDVRIDRSPPEEVASLVEAVREELEHHGSVREGAGSVEWHSVGRPSRTTVTLTPGPDSLRVRVAVNRAVAAGRTLGLSAALTTIAIAVTAAVVEPTSAAAITTVVGGWLGVGSLAGWTFWKTTQTRIRRRVESLLARLASPDPDAPTE